MVDLTTDTDLELVLLPMVCVTLLVGQVIQRLVEQVRNIRWLPPTA